MLRHFVPYVIFLSQWAHLSLHIPALQLEQHNRGKKNTNMSFVKTGNEKCCLKILILFNFI